MGKKDHWVVWPIYLDQAKSRGEGRMISKKDCVKDPKIEDIAEAARSLGLAPEVEREMRYPGQWYERPGRVLVKKGEPKSSLLRRIARAMRAGKR